MAKAGEKDEGGLMYQQLRKFINVIVSHRPKLFIPITGSTSSQHSTTSYIP